MAFEGFCKLSAGLTIFLLGLRFISVYTEKAVGSGLKRWLFNASKNRVVSCGLGAIITAVAQSSVATNMVAISFLNSNSISLSGACALVIGTNIGTTVTAQIVSLKFAGFFDFTSIGYIVCFIGFILSGNKKERYSYPGYSMLGFGFIFVGIETLSEAVDSFRNYSWFTNLFLAKSEPILLLNGFLITAICQSSSVVSSMLVVLASKNVIGFSSSAYLILGANVGTCIPVILATLKSGNAQKQVAVFNLLFNLFGSILFYVLFRATDGWFINFLSKTSFEVTRQIANFHTFFNLSVGVICLVVLKPLVDLCKFIVSPKKVNEKKSFKNRCG